MKTKYKFGTIFLIFFLFGSILGYTLAQSGNTFIISEGIYPQATYTVWGEGSTYYAKNDMGTIDYSGTNASIVINNVFNSLSGTSWESVLLKGDITLSGQLVLPSYIILEVEGILTFANNVNRHMIVNNDIVSGNTEIIIRGGTFDGNRANQDNDYFGVDLINSSRITIENTIWRNFGECAISLYQSETLWVLNNLLLNTAGIKIGASSYNAFVLHNRIWNTSHEYASDAFGINIAGSAESAFSYGIEVGYNEIDTTTSMGITVSWGSYRINIHDNRIYGAGGHGIEISHGDLARNFDVSVQNNFILDPSLDGIFYEGNNGVVSGNTVVGANWTGIIVTESYDISVFGNTIKSSNQTGMHLRSATNITVTGNTIIGNGLVGTYNGLLIDNRTSGGLGDIPQSLDIVISGNTILGSSHDYNIKLEDASDYILIDGNNLRTFGTGNYTNAGTGTNIKIGDNYP